MLVAFPSTEGHDPTAAAPSVLVVEDHPAHRQMTQALLEAFGCQVTLAANGLEAVDAARASAFEIIIMDRHMPHCGGDEATRLIRSLPGSIGDAVIICHSTDLPVGENAGLYDDALAKPATFEAILALLGRVRHLRAPGAAAIGIAAAR